MSPIKAAAGLTIVVLLLVVPITLAARDGWPRRHAAHGLELVEQVRLRCQRIVDP